MAFRATRRRPLTTPRGRMLRASPPVYEVRAGRPRRARGPPGDPAARPAAQVRATAARGTRARPGPRQPVATACWDVPQGPVNSPRTLPSGSWNIANDPHTGAALTGLPEELNDGGEMQRRRVGRRCGLPRRPGPCSSWMPPCRRTRTEPLSASSVARDDREWEGRTTRNSSGGRLPSAAELRCGTFGPCLGWIGPCAGRGGVAQARTVRPAQYDRTMALCVGLLGCRLRRSVGRVRIRFPKAAAVTTVTIVQRAIRPPEPGPSARSRRPDALRPS